MNKVVAIFFISSLLQVALAQTKGSWVTCDSAEIIGRIGVTTQYGNGPVVPTGYSVGTGDPVGEFRSLSFFIHPEINVIERLGKNLVVYNSELDLFYVALPGGVSSEMRSLKEIEKCPAIEASSCPHLFVQRVLDIGPETQIPKIVVVMCSFSDRIPARISESARVKRMREFLGSSSLRFGAK